jgi:hypothetical protein
MVKSIFVLFFVFVVGLQSHAQLPQLRGVDCNRSNTQLYQNLYANLTGGSQYRFRVTNTTTGVTDSVTNATRAFNLNQMSTLNRYNCSYSVQVSMDNGSGFGAYGNVCNPGSVALTTQLRAADCGKNLPAVGTSVYASVSSADSWDFQVRNVSDPGTVEDVFGLPTRVFRLTMAGSAFQLNDQEYEVRVRTTQGGVEQPFGNWCSIFTPAIISKLRTVDCGRSLTAIDYPLYADVTSAESWEFEIRNVTSTAITEVVNSADRIFRLTDASSQFQLTNEEYEIRVRTTQSGVVQPWGDWCSVFSPAIMAPEIIDGCGNTFEYLAYESITCTDVGATTYDWRLRQGTTVVATLNTSSNQVTIAEFLDGSNLPLYDYGITYNISARAELGGAWTGYGSACNVTTTAEPHSEVQFECGNTLNMLNQPIIFFAIWSATGYEYEVTDLTGDDGTQTISKSTKSFKLNELGTYSFGHDYSIRCRITFKGTQYSYSSACTISSPPPVTKLRSADCPKTLTLLGQKVYGNNNLTVDNPSGLDPVNTYQFRTVSPVSAESDFKSSRDITLAEILGSTPVSGTTYEIQMRVTYDGLTQAYGASCFVTTPSSMILIDNDEATPDRDVMKVEMVDVFPNPSNEFFTIRPKKEYRDKKLELRLYDLKGSLITIPENIISAVGTSELHFGRELIEGVYYLHVYDESGVLESIQLIKL